MAVALLARQRMREVREMLKVDRAAALNELEDIFQEGFAPDFLLDGRYSGQLIATTFHAPLDALVRFATSVIVPWKGRTFDIETGTGDNLVGHSAFIRLAFPRYRGSTSGDTGRGHAFTFRTSISPSLHYPDQEVLVIDYCDDENPGPVRRMVDEVVEIGEGYYLGRTLIQQFPCRWLCRAYFTLSELPDPVGIPWLDQIASGNHL